MYRCCGVYDLENIHVSLFDVPSSSSFCFYLFIFWICCFIFLTHQTFKIGLCFQLVSLANVANVSFSVSNGLLVNKNALYYPFYGLIEQNVFLCLVMFILLLGRSLWFSFFIIYATKSKFPTYLGHDTWI